MPVSSSPSMSQITNITKGAGNLNNSDIRYLLGVASGQISMSAAINKPASGSVSYTSPGTYSWLVVPYQTLSVTVNGAGGGGGGGSTAYIGWYRGSNGTAGGQSAFGSVIGYGGAGGGVQPEYSGTAAGGTASGGDTNTTGGGAAGGAGGSGNGAANSQAGGSGGRAVKSWTNKVTAGSPTWAGTVSVTVGTRGLGGGASGQGGGSGGNGTNGSVVISWS